MKPHDQDLNPVIIPPLSLLVEPLPPWLWRWAARERPGEAELCLELLSRSRAYWNHDALPRLTPAEAAALPAGAAPALLAALCAPGLDEAARRELDALDRLLDYLTDFPGANCAACAEEQALSGEPPDCRACPLREPPPLVAAVGELDRLLADAPLGLAAYWWRRFTRGLGPRRRLLLATALGRLNRRRRSLERGPGPA